MRIVHDLSPWGDPDEMLKALGSLSVSDRDQYRDAVMGLLDHLDPDLREEAIRTLFVKWKCHERRQHALNAFNNDEEPEVRAVAAYGIAATADDSTRGPDTAILLRRLKDELEQPAVRSAAYDALLILYQRPDFPTKRREFNPEVDVDWEWLRKLQ